MRIDSEVEQQVLRSIELDSAISSREICIESQDGVVTLSGTVTSYRESSIIYSATSRAPGVCGVVDKIEVKDDEHLIRAQAALPDQPISLSVSRHPAPNHRRLNAPH
jgi:hypothetical protein